MVITGQYCCSVTLSTHACYAAAHTVTASSAVVRRCGGYSRNDRDGGAAGEGRRHSVRVDGLLLMRESMLDSVIVARDKFLKKGGALYPSHARMLMVRPVPHSLIPLDSAISHLLGLVFVLGRTVVLGL